MDLRNLERLTDVVLGVVSRVPAPVFHNLAKARILKLAFWHVNLDGVGGAYVEFGVATGNSLRAAELAERFSSSASLGVANVRRKLYGFDTFSEFVSPAELDKHPTWNGSRFSVDRARVKRRFQKVERNRIFLFEVDATSLVDGKGHAVMDVNEFITDEQVAIVLFDMDLMEPTYRALSWLKPKLASGTMLIFDEFVGFSGDNTLGESGALQRFLDENPEMEVRPYAMYGDGGFVFQLTIR